MNTVELVPVSQWVYDLYKVSFLTAEAGRVIKTMNIAATDDSHMWGLADEHAPGGCEFMTYEIVKTDVGHPRVIGNLHGLSVYEDGVAHGKRLTA